MGRNKYRNKQAGFGFTKPPVSNHRGTHGNQYQDGWYDDDDYSYYGGYGIDHGSTYRAKNVQWLDSKDTKTRRVATLKPEPETETYKVVHSLKAWAQTQLLVNHFNDQGNEVSWFTPVIVDEDARTLTIPEIFVPEQAVTAGETDAPDLDIIVPEVLQAGYGLDVIRGWFHLHPNGLSVSPSQQDELQVEDYLDGGYSTLLRGIINDSGDFKLDYYDTDANLMFNNMDNVVAWGEAAEGVAEILTIAHERVKAARHTAVVKSSARTTSSGYTSSQAPVNGKDAGKAYTGLIGVGAVADDGSRLAVYGGSLCRTGEDALCHTATPQNKAGQDVTWRIVATGKTLREFYDEQGGSGGAVDAEQLLDACEKAGMMVDDVIDLFPTIFAIDNGDMEEVGDDTDSTESASVTTH